MNNDSTDVIKILADLLDKERAALLDGSLEEIGRIATAKDALLQGGKLVCSDHPALAILRQKVERNQQLLSAAMRGVRAVTARLEAMQNGPGELNTYNSSGQRRLLGGEKKGALQHRV